MMSDKPQSADSRVQASRSVLIDVLTVLAGDMKAITVVGGWVPELVFPGEGHIGSLDVDLALDGRLIKPAAYNTIREKLLKAGYRMKEPGVTNVFVRDVLAGSQTIVVKLDLITGEQEAPVTEASHQHIHGMMVSRLRGADLAFGHHLDVTVQGELPTGGHNAVTARVPTVAAFICMKSITMTERKREKDAYDIYFCLRHYPGGPKALAIAFTDMRGIPNVEEALTAMRSKFADQNQIGPVWAAQVAEEHGENAELVRRDAFERATVLLNALGVIASK